MLMIISYCNQYILRVSIVLQFDSPTLLHKIEKRSKLNICLLCLNHFAKCVHVFNVKFTNLKENRWNLKIRRTSHMRMSDYRAVKSSIGSLFSNCIVINIIIFIPSLHIYWIYQWVFDIDTIIRPVWLHHNTNRDLSTSNVHASQKILLNRTRFFCYSRANSTHICLITCMFAIQYHVPFQKNPTTS